MNDKDFSSLAAVKLFETSEIDVPRLIEVLSSTLSSDELIQAALYVTKAYDLPEYPKTGVYKSRRYGTTFKAVVVDTKPIYKNLVIEYKREEVQYFELVEQAERFSNDEYIPSKCMRDEKDAVYQFEGKRLVTDTTSISIEDWIKMQKDNYVDPLDVLSNG